MKDYRYVVGSLLFVFAVSGCVATSSVAQSHDISASECATDVALAGCSTHSGAASQCDQTCCDITADERFERGRPHQLIDGIGWVFGIPHKLILWDRRAENHDVSPDTEFAMRNYLDANGIHDVKVRINQYNPGGEWRRLGQNKNVAPAWRYTFGAVTTLGYTLFPGRLFGGDSYNPFTNTIHLFSDIPALAIHEGAYAADNASREFRGTYGALQQFNGINMWHETVAMQNATDYIGSNGQPNDIAEANRILPPLYGSRLGGTVGLFVPGGEPALTLIGAAGGHAVGWQKNLAREEGPDSSTGSPAIRRDSYSIH